MKITINSKTDGKYSEIVINGRNHIVAKIMPIAGDISMNGIYYPFEQIKKSFNQLDNLPAPNGHPKVNGFHVGASSPLAMNAHNIGGFIKSPKMDGKKVTADFVIDELVANSTADGKELIKRIKNSEKVGVSTGLNIDQLFDEKGVDDNGLEYTKIGQGFNFDHVAILLNEKAAGDLAGTELILNTENKDDPIHVVNMVINDRKPVIENDLIKKPNEDLTMNKEKLITAIMLSACNSFTVADEKQLTAMNEVEIVSALNKEMTEADAKELLTKNGFDFKAFDKFKKNASDFEAFMKSKKERKDEMKKEIVKNSEFTDEQLAGKDESELNTINSLITKSKNAKRVAEGGAPNGLKIVNQDYSM